MPELGKDVKSGSASSAEGQGNNQDSATKSDALEASSTSSDSKTGDKSNVSMADFVKQQIAQKHGASTAEEDESGEGEGEGDQSEEALDSKIETDEDEEQEERSEEQEESSDEEGEEESKEGEEDSDSKDEEDEDGEEEENESKDKKDDLQGLDPNKPVPYKRLKEVVDQKNELKKQLETSKTKVSNFDMIQNFCQQHNIQPSEFQEALRIQSLISTGNFSEAVTALESVVSQLKGVTGDVLPADLQKEVNDGSLSEERAKEIAKLRAQTQLGERSNKHKQQQEAQRQRVEYERQLDAAANNWVTTKQTSDPDFKPKKSESAVDGKYEEVQDKFQSLLNKIGPDGKLAYPITNPTEMVALLDKAYNIVNMKYRNSSKTKSPTGKRLTSTGSGSSTISQKPKKIEEAGSMAEAIQIGLNKHR